VDQTGSEESKQPAGERGTPSEPSAYDDRAAGEHSAQKDSPESARRAFDLLERFSGELEEILQSLERTRGTAASAEESPPEPERAYRPSSIHFDSSPISTRIDPYALPPVESPGTTSRTAPRLLLEALFLVLVAAISARTGLRPLLIAAAEAVAFLIVASIELAIARENRRFQRLPAAAPVFAAPETREIGTASGVTAVTLDQVEPLVWRTDRQGTGEADWPVVARELPREAEETKEAQEGVTEIAAAGQPPAEVAAVPEPIEETRPEVDLESAAFIPAAEPEPEAIAEPDTEAETEAESLSESPAEEVGREPEVEPEARFESLSDTPVADVEPQRPRRFHLFRREASEPEIESETEVEPEAELASDADVEPEVEVPEAELASEVETEPEVELEPEAQPGSAYETSVADVEPQRRFHLFRHEASEPEVDLEPAAEAEAEVEVESPPEVLAEESAPERPRRFHLLRHEASAPEIEPEAGLESSAEIPASAAEPERHGLSHLFEREEKSAGAEPELEVELESLPDPLGEEVEPERPRRFHLFRHEVDELEIEPETEVEPEAELASEVETEPEVELEPEAQLGNAYETSVADVEPQRRFHLFRHEASEPEIEPEAEPAPEAEPEAEVELTPEIEQVSEAEPEPETEVEPEAPLESISETSAADVEPERPRRFHLLRHEASEPETEPDVYAEMEAAAEPEAGAEADGPFEALSDESEPERPRRFHLFRHEERVLEAEMESELAAEPEVETEAEPESLIDALGENIAPERPRRFHLFRHEADEPETEPDNEAPAGRDDFPADEPWQSPFEELGRAVEPVEMTVEIELPPEIEVNQIEHTLEDLGRREPALRRRRWSLGTDSEKDVAAQAVEDETVNAESELRFAAEQERRRREREYLRNLRVSR